jgi:hypothetical protein
MSSMAPSVPLFFRLSAIAGEKRSQATTAPRRFQVDVAIGLAGRHVDVVVPYDARKLAERMMALGDGAFERYAEWLGARVPAERCRIVFVASPKRYDQILQAKGNFGRRPTGFTHYDKWGDGASYVQLPAEGDGFGWWPSALESTALHELSHCVGARQNGSYFTDWPSWWTEGSAELFSERALSDLTGTPRTQLPVVAERLRVARALLERGRWVPLVRLFKFDMEDARSSDKERVAAIYAEGAALLHFLDTTPEYRERLASYIRYVASLRSFLITSRMSARFKEMFGDLAALDAAWQAALRAQATRQRP